MSAPEFPAVLRMTLAGLRRGEGETRSEGRVPAAIAGFDSVHVTGRRSSEPAIRSILTDLELPVVFSRTPEFPGSEEALRLLDRVAGANGWVCDLGQTACKISARTQARKFPRDLSRLPIRTDGPGESISEQRRELRQWLVASLRTFSMTAPAPGAVLFALPSRLDDHAVPEGSSYIGMANDVALVPDVLRAAALPSPAAGRVLVMNDAELAALEAGVEPALRSCSKTLVITLGFGMGAALVTRGEEWRDA